MNDANPFRLREHAQMDHLLSCLRQLPTTTYLDDLQSKIHQELLSITHFRKLILLDKLYLFLQKSYEKSKLIGRGYHCFEHSLEFALLLLRLSKESEGWLPFFEESDALENYVAALLHDYDPRESLTPPSIEETLWHLENDAEIRSLIQRLELSPTRIRMMIERTDFPFTMEKEIIWQSRLKALFPDADMRLDFIKRAERFALADKASTYVLLSPDQAEKRVDGLAMELGKSKEELLEITPLFLEREGIQTLSPWLPPKYRNRWHAVKGHFEDLRTSIFLSRVGKIF